jgi:YggT family protein
MPSGYFTQPLLFLVEVIFGLYMTVVALRIIMQWAQWEYHNPMVQIIIKVTQVPVKFLRRFIPSWRKWDMATVVLLFSLGLVKISLIGLISHASLSSFNLVQLTFADIFSLFIRLFSASIIIQVILSWVQPHNSYNPIAPLLSRMNNPILSPIRRVMPDLSGLDLSPLVALLGLQLFSMLVLPLITAQF